MTGVSLRSVSRRFGDVVALDEVSLEIGEAEFFALLGPSGSGKTTCLRLIAGFDKADSGSITLFGENVQDLPPYRRQVNTVFQDYALFPHMNVRDNVAYGLMVAGVAKQARYRQAEEALAMMRLPSFGDRKPVQLSGGQRQRVALARAIINRPKLLLLDEPLGALDLKLREQMQEELKTLQKNLGITFVFITHDQGEALSMADRIAVFNQGRIMQVGTPQDIYNRPQNRFVADFVGSSNLLPPALTHKFCGKKAWASLRPESIKPVQTGGKLQAEVSGKAYLGNSVKIYLAVDDLSLTVLLPSLDTDIQVGDRLSLDWSDKALHIVEDE